MVGLGGNTGKGRPLKNQSTNFNNLMGFNNNRNSVLWQSYFQNLNPEPLLPRLDPIHVYDVGHDNNQDTSEVKVTGTSPPNIGKINLRNQSKKQQ